MYLKTLIAAIIVAAIVSGLAFTVNLNALFPDVLALFIVSLLGGCLTSVWVDESESIPAKPRKKTRKPTSGRPTSDRPTTSKETGSVKWFSPSKGFGFITRDNGDDIFVHFRSILGKGHRVLREGQRVEFAVTEGSKGLQAEDVDTINQLRPSSYQYWQSTDITGRWMVRGIELNPLVDFQHVLAIDNMG